MSNSKAKLRGSVTDILKKQASDNKKIFGILRQQSTGISLAPPQSIPSGAPSSGAVSGGVIVGNEITVLTHEDLPGQIVTAVNPAFTLLAKWKFEGFNPNEVATRRPIWATQFVLTANLKSSIGTNTASIRIQGSVNDISYINSAPGLDMQTSSTNLLIGRIERRAGMEFGSEPGTANHFVRIIVDTSLVGSSATYKNLKYTVLMIMPPGITVTKIFP